MLLCRLIREARSDDELGAGAGGTKKSRLARRAPTVSLLGRSHQPLRAVLGDSIPVAPYLVASRRAVNGAGLPAAHRCVAGFGLEPLRREVKDGCPAPIEICHPSWPNVVAASEHSSGRR